MGVSRPAHGSPRFVGPQRNSSDCCDHPARSLWRRDGNKSAALNDTKKRKNFRHYSFMSVAATGLVSLPIPAENLCAQLTNDKADDYEDGDLQVVDDRECLDDLLAVLACVLL